MKKVFTPVLRYLKQTDVFLLLVTLVAAAYGLLMVYSATLFTQSHKMFMTQLAAVLIGLTVLVIISKIDYHSFESIWKYLLIISVAVLIFTAIFGTGPSQRTDSHSWLRFFGMSVQPSEIVKILFTITFAYHLDLVKDRIRNVLVIVLLGLHGMAIVALVIVQGDTGTALVFLFMFVAMLFAAGVQMRYFAAGGILALIVAPILWNKFSNYQRIRFLVLFNPDKYAKDYAYQQIRATEAIGSGRFWGFGLFNGPKTQSLVKQALPERYNDFIFATVGEELGFIGAVLVFVVLLVIILRILYVSRTSKDFLGSMICIGVFSMFAIQTLANIGMCLFLAPVIGITLPFFSNGGTSIVTSMMGIGLVLSVYMRRSKPMFAGQQDE